jgi:hypothetical protein
MAPAIGCHSSDWRAALQRWFDPLLPTRGRGIRSAYVRFIQTWRMYEQLPGAEPLVFADSYPCLFDNVPATPYDPHYLHQAAWATERVLAESPREHVDVGSDVIWVGTLSAVVPVVFVDIRPLAVQLPQLRTLAGSLLGLPFADGSIASLSCLHVAEHVGLGRYGDELAPDGTRRACRELARILGSSGSLLFSVPIGRPRVCFNAHRIHSPDQILEYFADLYLREFSMVNDDYELEINADLNKGGTLNHGCGLFWFGRKSE